MEALLGLEFRQSRDSMGFDQLYLKRQGEHTLYVYRTKHRFYVREVFRETDVLREYAYNDKNCIKNILSILSFKYVSKSANKISSEAVRGETQSSAVSV